jgi:hypothetical protein
VIPTHALAALCDQLSQARPAVRGQDPPVAPGHAGQQQVFRTVVELVPFVVNPLPPARRPGPEGELLNVTTAACQLDIAPSTLLRWLNDGFVAGEQVTPGAPWRIRLTNELRGMLTDTAPEKRRLGPPDRDENSSRCHCFSSQDAVMSQIWGTYRT